jgi:hypothetical protein
MRPVEAVAAKQPRDMTPPRDRREAIDDAVDRIEMGAPPDQVFAAFEKAGIKRDEIIARGNQLGGKAFTPDTRQVTVREGARDGSLSSWTPTDMEGVANFGTRVGQQAKQAFVGGMANAGVLPASVAAPVLAASSKKAAAAMPSEDYQRGMEEMSGATTFGEAFSAVARNPAAAGLVVAESAALFVPVLAAAASVGLPAVGLAGVAGGFSGALEFGSAGVDDCRFLKESQANNAARTDGCWRVFQGQADEPDPDDAEILDESRRQQRRACLIGRHVGGQPFELCTGEGAVLQAGVGPGRAPGKTAAVLKAKQFGFSGIELVVTDRGDLQPEGVKHIHGRFVVQHR